jgi:hypothetical protein
MFRALLALALLCALAVFGLSPTRAQSGIQRCVDAQGRVVFTDGDCSAANALPQPAPSASGSAPATTANARTCALSRDDLLYGVRAALEAQDVNHLAAYYLWTGMGTREAYSLMDRLSSFSERPLMDAQLVSSAPEDIDEDLPESAMNSAEQSLREMPQPPAPEAAYADSFAMQGLDPDASALLPRSPPASPLQPASRRRGPDRLRVDQVRGEGDAEAVTTYFRIVPAAGCWWIRY